MYYIFLCVCLYMYICEITYFPLSRFLRIVLRTRTYDPPPALPNLRRISNLTTLLVSISYCLSHSYSNKISLTPKFLTYSSRLTNTTMSSSILRACNKTLVLVCLCTSNTKGLKVTYGTKSFITPIKSACQ
jgi:hypothetical protein